MKNLSILFFATLLLTFSACTKECKLGYTGSDCKDELAKTYFGKYEGVTASGNSSNQGYFEVGTLSSSATEISIGSFKAVMESNEGDFYLPAQTINLNGYAYTAYGKAYFGRSTLDIKAVLERPGTFTSLYFTGIKTQ